MRTLLDTGQVAPSERSNYWSAGITEHFFPMHVDSVGSLPFAARLRGGQLGAVDIRSIIGAPHRVRRTPRLIAEGDSDSLLLYLLRRGSCRIEQDGRSCVLGPGDLATQDTSRPSTFELVDAMDMAVFSFPKRILGPGGDALARCTAMRVPHGKEPVLQLGIPFLANVARTLESGPVSKQEADCFSDMLVAMLWAFYVGKEPASWPESRSEMLLDHMRRYALENLQNPGLGPEQIARAHFISTRYVHKLFASSGCGVSTWIREQRLERALADLRRSRDVSIAVIASRWGYRDPASFSRVFRQTYGCSPRELRRRA